MRPLADALKQADLATLREALAPCDFRDPAKAARNLLAVHAHLPGGLAEEPLATLLAALDETPDADMALNHLERFAAALGSPPALAALMSDPPRLKIYLALFGSSQSLSTYAAAYPEETLAWLTPSILIRPLTKGTLARELQTVLEAAPAGKSAYEAAMAPLRRFRHRTLIRIALRDLLGLASLSEVTQEIALLADATLETAYRLAWDALVRQHGPPLYPDAEGKQQPCRFTVLAMGKLGGEELNFSSDIDLLFLYTTEKGETAPERVQGDPSRRISNHPFCTKLAEWIVRALGAATEDGFVFRVDTRLRPDGVKGDLALPLRSYEIYYESWGKTWERAALLKARPAAGDEALGEAFLRMIAPFCYRKYLDFGALAEIREMKEKIDQSVALKGRTYRDVKLGYGGIREIEFLVQALQLIYGAREQGIRERNTLKALHKLAQKGLLSYEEQDRLARSYTFLRTVEHRIQILHEQQTQTLPDDPVELELLARRAGYRPTCLPAGTASKAGAAARLLGDYERHTHQVRAIYDQLFREPSSEEGALPASSFAFIFDRDLREEDLHGLLKQRGFRDPVKALRNIQRLIEGSVYAHSTPRSRRIVTQVLPLLLEEIAASPQPDLALNTVEEFIAALRGRETFYALLRENPTAMKHLADLFSASEHLSRLLIRRPELVDLFFYGAERMTRPKPKRQMAAELREAVEAAPTPGEQRDALRRFKHQEEIRIGFRDITGGVGFVRTARELTHLAEVCLAEALRLAAEEIGRRYGAPREGRTRRAAALAVLGVGKLGGRELTYGSDLDLLFVYSADGETSGPDILSNHEYFAKIAEKATLALGALTREGAAFRVDTRLRPTGSKGPLAQSLEAFRSYYALHAETWERQAFVKARWVAGDASLGRRFLRTLHPLLFQDPPAPDLAARILAMRARMEEELAKEGETALNLKIGRGGIVDIEFLVQYLQLREGGRRLSLRKPGTLEALEAAAREGILSEETARRLRDAYLFLRTLESRLRVMHNVSASLLPRDPDRLGPLARTLGFADAEALLEAYRCRTAQVQQAFEQIVAANP